MGSKDHPTDQPDLTTTRRSLLGGAGLTTIAYASLTLAPRGAVAAPLRESKNLEPGAIPPDAAASLRLFRGATLLALASSSHDQGFASSVQALAGVELARQAKVLIGAGGSSAYTPNPEDPDLCPPWWPWPFPWPPYKSFELPPDDLISPLGRASLDLFHGLTTYNLAFQQTDLAVRGALQAVALREVEQSVGALFGSGLASWEPGDDICPPWWPWPWPPRRRIVVTPRVGVALRELVSVVMAHNVGARLFDEGLRATHSKHTRREILAVAKSVGSGGGSYSWEPGDDICPPWWPWPWPGPRRLDEVLRLGPQPDPWREAAREIFRGATVFALSSGLDDRGLASELQSVALTHVHAQSERF